MFGEESDVETNGAAPIEGKEPELEAGAAETTEEGAAENAETEPEVEDPDLEDFEWEGKSLKLPKGLKDRFLMHEDYTRKTQAVSQEKRAVEETKQTLAQREQEFTKQVESQTALLGEYAELRAMSMSLERYQEVDWQRLDEEDPIGAQRAFREYQNLKDAAQAKYFSIQQKETERTQTAQREDAKRTEDFRKSLAAEIKDWSPELDLQLTNFARSRGIPDQELRSIRNVGYVKLLREAMEGVQLKEQLRKQVAAAKTKQPSPDDKPKPLEKPAKGQAPATRGLSDDLPVEDWVKLRNNQVRRRNAA